MARPRKQRLRKKIERKLSKNKLDKKSVLKNYGIFILAIAFVNNSNNGVTFNTASRQYDNGSCFIIRRGTSEFALCGGAVI